MQAIQRMIREKSQSPVLRKSILTLFIKVVSAGLLFLFNILIARYFGAAGSGVYFLAWTIVNIVVTLSRMGFENTVTRFVAVAHDRQDWESIRGVYAHAFRITAVAGSLATVLLLIFSEVISAKVFSSVDLPPILSCMALAVVPTALYYLHAHLLKGLHRPVTAMAVLSLWAPALGIAGLLIMGERYGLLGATAVFVLAAAVTCIIARVSWVRADAKLTSGEKSFSAHELVHSSLPNLVGSGYSLLIMWLPTLILGVYASTAEVGIFSAANRVATLISFVQMAVAAVIGPKLAVFYSKGEFRQMERLGRKVALGLTLLVLPAFVAILFASEQIMLVFGHEFDAGATLLLIMAIGQLINVMTGPVGLILVMSGHEYIMRDILLVTAIVGLLLSWLLIPVWQGLGAAWSVAITVILQNVLSLFFVRKKLGVKIFF